MAVRLVLLSKYLKYLTVSCFVLLLLYYQLGHYLTSKPSPDVVITEKEISLIKDVTSSKQTKEEQSELGQYLTSKPSPDVVITEKEISLIKDVTSSKQTKEEQHELGQHLTSKPSPDVVLTEKEIPLIKDVTSSKQTKEEQSEITEKILYQKLAHGKRGQIQLTPAGLEFIKKSSVHELSAQEPYKTRMDRIMEKCLTNTDTTVDLSRIIYNDKRNYLMCEIPKAASTALRRFWWHFAGYKDYKTVSGNELVIHQGLITTLDQIPVHDALVKLRNYTTFFVQRHPFERLVSAYTSKFTNRYKLPLTERLESYYRKKYGKPAADRFLPHSLHGIEIRNLTGGDFEKKLEMSKEFQHLSPQEQNLVREAVFAINVGEIDFDTFVKMIIEQFHDMSAKKIDVHWRTHMDLCNPCAVRYDYIIDFDNLAQDTDRLLDYLQQDKENKISFESKDIVVHSSETVDELSSLSTQTLAKLIQTYERDFQVLGFSNMSLNVN